MSEEYEMVSPKDIRAESKLYVWNIMANDREIAKRMAQARATTNILEIFSVEEYLVACADALIPYLVYDNLNQKDVNKLFETQRDVIINNLNKYRSFVRKNPLSDDAQKYFEELRNLHRLVVSKYYKVGSVVPDPPMAVDM